MAQSTNVSPWVANAPAALGLFASCVGLNSILRPAHSLSLLHFPKPSQPDALKLTCSLVQMSGARNFAMGLTTLVAWYNVEDRRTLSYILMASLPVALIDGFISKAQIGAMEWEHWVFVPIGLILNAKLGSWI